MYCNFVDTISRPALIARTNNQEYKANQTHFGDGDGVGNGLENIERMSLLSPWPTHITMALHCTARVYGTAWEYIDG